MKTTPFLLGLTALLGAQTPPTETLRVPSPPPPTAPAQQSPAPKPAARPAAPERKPEAAPAAPARSADPASLSFFSDSFQYYWDRTIPMDVTVDGLKITEIYFNVRKSRYKILSGPTLGSRAHLTVSNTSTHDLVPGFAVAVFDGQGKLLGVASGGTKLGTVKAGETEEFDLNFSQVKNRLPKGEKFTLSVELRN